MGQTKWAEANVGGTVGSVISSAAKEADVGNWRSGGGIVWMSVAGAFVIATGMNTPTAHAHKEFDLSVGYAHVELDGSESPFDYSPHAGISAYPLD